MQCLTKKIRPPVKWHGGKTYLARRIIDLFPPHDVYVEPFVGGGSVLLNKPPSQFEFASDSFGTLVSMWETLKKYPIGITLAGIPYSRKSFEKAKGALESNRILCEDDSAVCFIVRNRMSRGGLGKDFAWSDRLRGGQPGDVNAWQTFIRDDLPAIVERIQRVTFTIEPAIKVLGSLLSHNTVIYCDPPYLHETRTHRRAYDHEMSRDDHAELLDVLVNHPSRIFLSGYRSDLYDSRLKNWRRVDFDMPNHSGQGKTKQRRTECVWTNT